MHRYGLRHVCVIEPVCFEYLHVVHGNFTRSIVTGKGSHQLGRKGPALAGKVADVFYSQGHFFKDLPLNTLLKSFPCLQKAGEYRGETIGMAGMSCEEQFVISVDGNNNARRDWWVVQGMAVGALHGDFFAGEGAFMTTMAAKGVAGHHIIKGQGPTDEVVTAVVNRQHGTETGELRVVSDG